MERIKKFFYTYTKIFSISYKVSPRLMILIILSNSVWGLSNLPVLYINKMLIDVVLNTIGKDYRDSLSMLITLVVSRGLIELVRSIFSNFNWSLSNSLTERIQAKLDLISSEKLNNLDVALIESPEFQDRYKKIEREANSRVWGMIKPVSDLPNAIFTVISGAIPIFAFKPWIAFVVILFNLPEILINTRVVKRDYEESEILNPKWRIWGWLKWTLTDSSNYYENRILGATRYLAKKLSVLQQEIIEFRFKRRVDRVKMYFFGTLPNFVLSAFLNIYFFALAILGKITLGSAQLLYGATGTLTNGFVMLTNNGLNVYENYLFVRELAWFLDLDDNQSLPSHTEIDDNKPVTIEFRNVWFKYPNTKKFILKGVSFSVDSNKNIALVGENGAGKTTIIKLLCGFYKPTKGDILYKGISINRYSQREYWDELGVLFQEYSQYPFSVKESIGIGRPIKINDLKSIKKAAKLTGIDEYIDSLPLKYDTPLYKEFAGGVDPSKGQWQRIALARTLFRDSRVVVLDEPTSNVDPKAEKEIFEKIIELSANKTLILISHRYSTVRMADKIINLSSGVISEQGSHEELMLNGGEYSKLFKLQAKGYQ